MCNMGVGEDSNSYVSPAVKYLMFIFNFIFWLIGVAFIAIGTWAYIEKSRFDYGKTDSTDDSEALHGLDVYDLVFDLTIILIILGCVIWVIAFPGCLGALRENICLLKTFSYAMGGLFLVEVILAILAFVFSSEVKAKVTSVLKEEGIIRYRDDPDLRNLIDWSQKTFKCCGVGVDAYRDWSLNAYFNCTDDNPSIERCGVPYSCCVAPNDVEVEYINTMCGYNVQGLSFPAAAEKVWTTGCVDGILKLAEENLYIIGGVALGLAVPQLINILLGCMMIRGVKQQKEQYV